jgi:release factor glutamine methyltransferase
MRNHLCELLESFVNFVVFAPMTNSKTLFNQIVRDLKLEESEDEINALAFAVLNYFGISRTDVISSKPMAVELDRLNAIVVRLNRHEPIQYITNEAWFYGRKFFVDPSVLIPRPETELIIEEVKRIRTEKESFEILDIGTGSGCIAISLALEFPMTHVVGIDVSDDALTVANQNATRLSASVDFQSLDVLNELPTGKFDLVVSNPPYVSIQEKTTLAKNVVDYEPHLALFAHESDALIFYRAIAQIAAKTLNTNGGVIVEINERFGDEVCALFSKAGLKQNRLTKDHSGKNRFAAGNKE